MRTIKFEGVEHIDARDEHAEQRVLHHRALAEIECTEKGKQVLENCPLLTHTHRIDPSADELTRGSAYCWLTITKPIANNQLALGDR